MYVDGLLAENHGLPPLGFDPLLAERDRHGRHAVRRSSRTGRRPTALPAGGPHLAYLDVWEREVTYLEDPDLVEVAVGVDTTARTQTAWQVRLLPNIGSATLRLRRRRHPRLARRDPPVAPGRLTTDTIAVAPDDDPCELPPTRRLPRAREPDLPRRDPRRRRARHRHLQVVARQRLGRDPGRRDGLDRPCCGSRRSARTTCSASRPATGSRSSTTTTSSGSKPGEIRKVTVDDAERTITFTGAIPADLRPASADRRRRAAPARAALGPVRRRPRRHRRAARRPRRARRERRDHGAGLGGDAGRARERRRRLVLDRRRRQRPVPARRPLDLRRAHGRHVDRDPRRGAAARRPPPLRPARHGHVPRLADRLPPPMAAARRRRAKAATARSA